jgi:SAM-dependent methyltransferase
MSDHNRVPYINSPYAQTHPSRLFVQGRLEGLWPHPVETCRVLELGASKGENLAAMAAVLPSAEFLGIEYAEVPVAEGRRMISELGLDNMRLERMDVLDIGDELGRFDYIIAHGLYSWTPEAVRDKILAVARANLNPDGIAYVSYNAYPGRHLEQMLREMMLYHVGNETNPAAKLGKARELLKLVASARPERDAFEAAVAVYAEEFIEKTDSSLMHDELCDSYHAVYFHEFIAHAARHGLKYAGEADPQDAAPRNVSLEALSWIREAAGGDRLAEQQYLDFARVRKFRQTLLCHEECETREGSAEGCWAAGSAQEPETGVFVGPHGTRLKNPNPRPTAYLRRLMNLWPEMERVSSEDAGLAQELHRVRLIELHGFPGVATRPGASPCASRFARYQLAKGEARVTTLAHRTLELADEDARKLVLLADGSRTREDLAREMGCTLEVLDNALETFGKAAIFTS